MLLLIFHLDFWGEEIKKFFIFLITSWNQLDFAGGMILIIWIKQRNREREFYIELKTS